MRDTEPRPEHREIDPSDPDVVDLGKTFGTYEEPTKLRCTECKPYRTRPVRKRDDPDTVVRCAQCGKRHSTASLEVIES